MYMKISEDQFTLSVERLTHEPTGAVFWLAPNDVVLCESGSADQKIGDEHDYSLQDLKEAAWSIFKLDRKPCI